MKHSVLILLFLSLLVSCGKTIARKPIVRKTSTYLNESISFNKKLIALEENAFKAIIINDSLNTYFSSPNGFRYKYDKKSLISYLPKFGDEVIFNYEVRDLNNSIIYSNEVIGNQKYVVDQQEIVEGLRNGLKLMNEGDIVTFLFPSHKVFGYLGDQKKIEINQPLIYKVQLNKIKKKNESN